MEETLYVEYLMEETLSAGVYNRVNTFSVSVMEETLSVIFRRNVSSKGRNSNSFCRVIYGRNISSKESNSFCRVIMEETLSAKDESTFL